MLPRLAHANHHDLRERRVAAGARSTRFLLTSRHEPSSSPFIRTHALSQSACPRRSVLLAVAAVI